MNISNGTRATTPNNRSSAQRKRICRPYACGGNHSCANLACYYSSSRPKLAIIQCSRSCWHTLR